jgi:mediator of RNA polymerase II transcription subunit 7
VFKVLNAYRPHQARETLILMMEEQIRTIRAETEAVRESVGRAREVVEGLARGGEGGDMNGRTGEVESEGEKRRGVNERREKRVWEVLEREVGRI